MLFDRFTEGLLDTPSFQRFSIRDVNPVSGRVRGRTVFAPNEAMKVIHRRFLEHLRSWNHREAMDRVLRYSTACRPGDSTLGNLEPHRKNRFVYAVDLTNAFPSVGVDKLVPALLAFDQMGTGGAKLFPDAAELGAFLERYFLVDGGLAVGGPASADLFNITTGISIDVPLGKLCDARGFAYTRYLDDLTISSGTAIGERTRWNIRRMIESAGFAVNLAKTEYCDLSKRPIQVTGIMLELGGRIFLPRHYTRMLLGLMHRAQTKGDVDLARVHGLMGVFYGVTGRDTRRMNRTELKVHQAYRAFSERVK